MNGYLLDTHIWLWYLEGSERLPPGLRTRIDGAPEPCWLSPISVWETSMLVQKGKYEIAGSLREWLTEARGAFPIREAGLNNEIALTTSGLDLAHKDPADRFICATAQVYDATLLTVDRRLLSLRSIKSISH